MEKKRYCHLWTNLVCGVLFRKSDGNLKRQSIEMQNRESFSHLICHQNRQGNFFCKIEVNGELQNFRTIVRNGLSFDTLKE